MPPSGPPDPRRRRRMPLGIFVSLGLALLVVSIVGAPLTGAVRAPYSPSYGLTASGNDTATSPCAKVATPVAPYWNASSGKAGFVLQDAAYLCAAQQGRSASSEAWPFAEAGFLVPFSLSRGGAHALSARLSLVGSVVPTLNATRCAGAPGAVTFACYETAQVWGQLFVWFEDNTTGTLAGDFLTSYGLSYGRLDFSESDGWSAVHGAAGWNNTTSSGATDFPIGNVTAYWNATLSASDAYTFGALLVVGANVEVTVVHAHLTGDAAESLDFAHGPNGLRLRSLAV